MKRLAILAVCFATACVRPPDFTQVSLGMTEAQVQAALGKPLAVSGKDNVMIYTYQSYQGLDHHDSQFWYVRFVDGKVESYGHQGDFDSTTPPTQRVIIENKSK